jgi:hypothetical protein
MDKLTKRFGTLGSQVANIITVLTANWGIVVSVATGVVASVWSVTLGFFQHPAVQVAIGVSLATLWSIIGVTYLADRRRPRIVRTSPDYRYGLTFEGLIPNLVPHAEDAWLGLGVQIRNFTQAPIRYSIEKFDIRIGTRTLPKTQGRPLKGYLARGGAKIGGAPSFKKDDLREFFGKRVVGTAECSIIYGHPEEAPVRRLTINMELHFEFTPTGDPPLTFGADIIDEIDEPYEKPPLTVRGW